jgi:hypothetical protein
MHDFWEFIKRTWWLFLILFFAPIIIIFIFFIDEYVLHHIDMSAGEWANLLGATFGYWGTVLLGVLAFWQNERTALVNEKLFAFEDINKKINNTPKLKILGCEIFCDDRTYESEFAEENNFRGDFNYIAKFNNISLKSDYIELFVLIKNDSSSDINNLTYNGFGYLEPKKKMFSSSLIEKGIKFGNKQMNIDHLEQYGEIYLDIKPRIYNNAFIYQIKVEYHNVYHHKYTQLISLVAKNLDYNNFEVHFRHYDH